MSWARVPGHEPLVQAFERAFRRGRLAHAYLFAGPEGVGKRQFAVGLAKVLLCETREPAVFDACDHCPGCTQVDARTHPDFQLVSMPEEKHEFPIGLMHEVIRGLALKPARHRHRVAIIEDADSLSDEAANCFLKTLEEPPPKSLLVLLGTSVDRQLPTIRSRCQLIRFPRLAEERVAERLLQEGVTDQPDEACRLARLSGGSLAEARLLADPAFGKFRHELLQGLSAARIDSVALAGQLVRFVEEASKESAPRRQRAGLGLNFVVEFLRAAVMIQQGGTPGLANAADLPLVRRLAERADLDQLLSALERCLEADYQVDRRLQLVLVLEALLDAVGQQLQTTPVR